MDTPETPMDTPETPHVATPHKARRHLLINHQFALLWTGQTISIFGDYIFNTTLIVWIAIVLTRGQIWTPLAVSGIFLVSSLATIVLGPVAGVLVDHWNKRLALAWASFLPAACLALLLLQISYLPSRQIGLFWQLVLLYLVVFLLTICTQIARPTWLALTGQIVAQQEQAQAMGLDQASSSLSMLIGPALAPPLLLAFGPKWALLIDLLSFLISTLTILLIRTPQNERDQSKAQHASFLIELRIGVTFLFKNALLQTLLILSVIAWLGGGILAALDIFFVTHNLHTPPALYGFLDAALGVGTILGALLAGALGERIGLMRLLWGSTLTLGALLLIYARLTSFAPALIVIFFVGIPFAAISVVSGPLLLRAIPQELLGRVSSLFNLCSTLALLLGSMIAGALDSALTGHFHSVVLGLTFGPVDTLFLSAGLLLLISGFYAMLSLRHVDAHASPSES